MERERERERQQHAATWVEEEPELQNQAGKLNIEMTYCTPGLPCALFWNLHSSIVTSHLKNLQASF
jgi:hypothetical protein